MMRPGQTLNLGKFQKHIRITSTQTHEQKGCYVLMPAVKCNPKVKVGNQVCIYPQSDSVVY